MSIKDYLQLIVVKMDNLPTKADLNRARSGGGSGASSGSGDAFVRKNRASVVEALRKLHKRYGWSIPKSVRILRRNPRWTERMKGVADRSWTSYYYDK